MKLEPKYLAPYLPYKLNIGNFDNVLTCIDVYSDTVWIKFRGYLNNQYKIGNIKPILRPLSDLEYLTLNQKQQELKTQEDTLIYWSSRNYMDLDEICYNDIQWFLKNHFDVFGLIEQGLAIDINTL